MTQISITQILDILSNKGHQQYDGEAVSQLEHALQCATIAQKAGANAQMITACLLHDLGHLIDDLRNNLESSKIDPRHEYRALELLRSLFPVSVTEVIRLHVEAKRYLCAIKPNYYDSLSSASKHSLTLQGGIFSPTQASEFIRQPFAHQAVQLRCWDEMAKVPDLPTPSLEDFVCFLLEAVH